MKILVNGKEAVLKAGSSFEYVSENPLFTEAEDYSLEIEFPMKDCPQNILIFGALHVKGVDISTVTFPCRIMTETFDKSGILTITEVNDASVKAQFLEGMSQENFAGSYELGALLTDLDFGDYDGTRGGWENFPDGDYSGDKWKWDEFPIYDKKADYVIPPVISDPDGHDYYTRHIYLAYLMELIFRVLPGGWTVDDSALKELYTYRFAIVANTRRFNMIDSGERIRPLSCSLPMWSVREFLRQVGYFYGCMPLIDNTSKKVTFVPYKQYGERESVNLVVLDDFSVELGSGDNTYIGNKGLKLPEDSGLGKLNDCDYLVDDPRIPHQTITSRELLTIIKNRSWNTADTPDRDGFGVGYLYYLSDKQVWAVISKSETSFYSDSPAETDIPDQCFQQIEVINQYGRSTGNIELKIVPVMMAEKYDEVQAIYGRLFTKIPSIEIPDRDHDERYDVDVPWRAPNVMDRVNEGRPEEKDFCYDKLWLVRHTGISLNTEKWLSLYDRMYETDANHKPKRDEDGEVFWHYYPVTLVDQDYPVSPFCDEIRANAALPQVDETKLYRYKFLASSLPSATAIYVIKGKRYACLRLTAHFTTSGMSELVEGEFYEIVG